MFGRRGGSGRHSRAGDARRSGPRHAAVGRREDESGAYPDDDYADRPVSSRRPTRGGPYDVTDAPDGVPRLDLGSLQVPAIDGVEVRVQANQEGQIQQVVLVHGPSALQLGVFAAPKSEGIWDEVREEIRESLVSEGAAIEEIDGDFGIELRAGVRTPEGMAAIRFVGVDGPRWMVRGLYQGPAAAEPALAGPLAVCLRELVVDRGNEAKPVREPLPLRLPREMAEQAAAASSAAPPPAGPVAPGSQSNGAGRPQPDDPAPASRRRPSPRPHPRRPA